MDSIIETEQSFFARFKRQKKPIRDKLEIIVCGKKVNEKEIQWMSNKIDHDYTVEEIDGTRTEYKVNKEDLLKMKLTFLEKAKSFLHIQQIKNKYIILFDKGIADPKIIDFVEPKILNSKLAFTVINSRVSTMGNASIRDIYREGWKLPKLGKTLLFIIVGVVVSIIIIYGYLNGWFSSIPKW